ncbi:MAG: hypothetical protein ACRDWV_07635, partial [Acidimicrobiales bacterium]
MQTTETSTPFSRHQSWTLLIASLASFKIAMDPLLLAGLGSAMVFPTAIASAVFAAHGSFATSLTFVQGVRPALDALALIGFAGALSAL